MSSIKSELIKKAKNHLIQNNLSSWLIYNYKGSNPFFEKVIGRKIEGLTRPIWLVIKSDQEPIIITHKLDSNFVRKKEIILEEYTDRESMINKLKEKLPKGSTVAMEYSPNGLMPRTSFVDAGTIDICKNELGLKIISSGNIIQDIVGKWTKEQLNSHLIAGEKLKETLEETFDFIGSNIHWKLTEFDVAEFIRGKCDRYELVTNHGPVVAVDQNTSFPHYEPNEDTSRIITRNSWLLIDLWAKTKSKDSVYSDITWVAQLGDTIPEENQKIFEIVKNTRDLSFNFIKDNFKNKKTLKGFEVDQIARKNISDSGYGDFFTHRLGHSIGTDVHSVSVNLDSFETVDERHLTDGIGFSIEPGIYLDNFGVRSEINVFINDQNPEITTPVQNEIITINTKSHRKNNR